MYLYIIFKYIVLLSPNTAKRERMAVQCFKDEKLLLIM